MNNNEVKIINNNYFLKEGDTILLESGKKKRWIITLKCGEIFHSHFGSFYHDSLIGMAKYGSNILLMRGNLFILKPTLRDYLSKFKKATNILYEDDAAAIVGLSGISDGDTVLEIGTGSGGLTTYLANAIKPNGKVITIDINSEHSKAAQENIKLAQFEKSVEFYIGDLRENEDIIPIDNINSIFIDFPSPWELIDYVINKLTPGGQVFFFVPNASQVEKIVGKGLASNLYFTDIFEVIRKDYRVNPIKNIFHPENRQIVFTGIVSRAIKKVNNIDLKEEFSVRNKNSN